MKAVVLCLGHQFFCKEDLEGCVEVGFEDSNDVQLIDFSDIFFFSTSMIVSQRSFTNPYMKGKLIMMLSHCARSSSRATIFQMD